MKSLPTQFIFPFVASDKQGLIAQLQSVKRKLETGVQLAAIWERLIYDFQVKSSLTFEKLVIICNSSHEFTAVSDSFITGQMSNSYFYASDPSKANDIVFLFTGQGSQYAGMGYDLFLNLPLFQRFMLEANEIFQNRTGVSILDVMFDIKDRNKINKTIYAQPSLFILEYALAKTWISLGVKPKLLLGHSVGECAAACFANMFTLEEGLILIAERARLMQSLPSGGGMTSVLCDYVLLNSVIDRFSWSISIAAVNGPNNVVVAGDLNSLNLLHTELDRDSIKYVPLDVSHAFHSNLMDPILDDFEKTVSQFKIQSPNFSIISNLSGQPVSQCENQVAGYWREHIRRPVQFYSGMKTISAMGEFTYLEVGPTPVLVGMGKKCLPDQKTNWFSSLQKAEGYKHFLANIALLFVTGHPIQWNELLFQEESREQIFRFIQDNEVIKMIRNLKKGA